MERYEAYKDSGVEWLGEIPVGWEINKLKYGVSKVGSGVTPRGGANIYQLSGIPLLRSQNIHVDGIKMDDVAYIGEKLHDSMSNSKVQAGDVLLNITGASIGRCFYVEENFGEANVNQHVCIIRPNGKINTSYLYFVLRSDLGEEQIKIEQTGSGREGLNFEALNNFIIPYLSVEEQTAIANFLDRKTAEIDALIAQKERLLELYEEEKTAIINHAVTKGLDPNAEFKDSGVEWIGDIPAAWEVKKLKYEVLVNPLKDKLDRSSDELVTFLPMDSISENGEVDCSFKKPISSVCNGFTFFRKNDVIVAKITPCFENGKCVLLSDLDTSIGFGSTEFHVLRPKARIVGNFLYYMTKSEVFMQTGEAFMYGAAGQKRVPSVFISDFPLVLPNADEQTTIANFLDRKVTEINAKIAKTLRIIELQKEYRTALISEVVTGKIKVPELPTQEASA